MYTFGVDIGSTTSKCAVLKDGTDIVSTSLFVGGTGTRGAAQAVEEALLKAGIARDDLACVTVTGYGRNRFEGADYAVSELTCHALGAHLIFPECRTLIDIGGQDAKVIALNDRGRMTNFLMNDKCAAGTGRFLDVMAGILQLPIGELERYAARAAAPVSISSTCTVFAESEVISQLAGGADTADLVAGICESVAARVASLARRMELRPAVCMSGGVARNGGVRAAMEKALGQNVLYSEHAQLFGAIGAALYGWQKRSA